MTTKIFSPENIKRLRAMEALGADRRVMAIAIGSKSANALSARATQLGIFKEKSVEVAGDTAAA